MSDNIETNRLNFNVDWRAEKGSYDEQMEHFYMNEEFADVNFVFNRHGTITVSFKFIQFICYRKNFQEIPAHKVALAVASEVFQKEFTYGDGAEESHTRSKTLQVLNRLNSVCLDFTLCIQSYNQPLRTRKLYLLGW